MRETSHAESRLLVLRRARGQGLREAAREIPLDPGQLSRIERGLERPSPRVLLMLARYYGLRDVERVLSEFYEQNGSRHG